MGNKREQLKEDIARELKRKIETAQYLLDGLRIAQHDVKTDCEKAKYNFQMSMNELIQTLTLRNTELVNKIDSLCATQINSLQESIQATYVTLGSLQSTLTNLDSFDNAQLLNLVMPNYEMSSEGIEVSFLDVNSECTQLKDQINTWGSVQSKELSTLEMSGQGAAPGSCNGLESSAQVVPECDGDMEFVDDWVDKPGCGGEGDYDQYDDDFDFILCGGSGDSKRSSTCELAAAMERSLEIGSSKNEPVAQTVPEMVPRPLIAPRSFDEDLSKWLRPKRTHSNAAAAQPRNNVVPEELVQKFPSFSSSGSSSSSSSSVTTPSTSALPHKSVSIATKRQYLDFPCLRLDPNCWLQNKRMKDAQTLGHTLVSDVCTKMSHKEIIPPTYALPYPFWLKK